MFLIVGIICAASSLIGYHQYKSSIQQLYNNTAYDTAEVAISYLSTEEIRELSDLAKGYSEGTVSELEISAVLDSDRYKEVARQFDLLRDAMGANDVFLFYLDMDELSSYNGDRSSWKPIKYIFDSYTVPEYSYVLGDTSSFNPEYINELHQIATTGEVYDSYFISEGDYGYNTAALLPISDESGVIAIASVEIPMLTLKDSLHQYVVNAIVVTIVIIMILNLIYMAFLYVSVIRPIDLVAAEAISFTKNDNRISEKLGDVRTHDEIQALAEGVLMMERDINDHIKNLTRVTAEKERIGTELDIAKHIQSSMLPCIFPAFPECNEFDIYATMDPAKEVGGDFYDFFMVDKDHLAIVMADVSGKGVPAALFMVIGKTLIKDHTVPGADLGDIFSEVNNLLCESNSEGLFITAFEGVLDLRTGELRFVNAGHEQPFLTRSDGSVKAEKIRPGFVLAGMEDMKYKAGTLTLHEGDKIFQYTDGITEATDSSNNLYGMERLEQVLYRNKDRTPEEICKAVRTDIDAFVKEAPQFDDITMLCLEFKRKKAEKGGNTMKELTIDATVENIEVVTDFINDQLEHVGCPQKIRVQIDIAIDELFGNIAHYAYNPEVGPATVTVEVTEDPAVIITFVDNGIPYDPLKKDDPDVTLSAEERDIGGLGIYMVKKTMDDIVYEYKEGKNILRVKKNLN